MVDVIQAPRSTGSILKPFLYAAMLNDGLLLPNTLVADIPMQFDGFTPQNYSETFDGAVPASQALSRSLNIPAVVMLRDYGYPRFYHLLKKLGFTHFNQPADHYGLSLILGGGETSLWDVTNAYAGMSRTLNHFHSSNGKYFTDNYAVCDLQKRDEEKESAEEFFPPLDAGSIWCTYKALLEVNRPETELGWEAYSSSTPIAWKTGTSFGNRDAWAVGTTPEYVVGVWIGNADGQGRPMLTGVTAAAPLLFDIFSRLPNRTWFTPPYDALTKTAVCHESGMQPGMYCEHIDTTWTPLAGKRTSPCSYHQQIFTDEFGSQRLNANCASMHEMIPHSWFVLPAVQEHYYKSHHPEYKDLPAFAPGCNNTDELPIGLIYPKSDARVYVPKNISGQKEKIVLEATHRAPDAVLYWHFDNEFVGETRVFHQLEIAPSPGKHTLTILDQHGNTLTKSIVVIEK
jgi:penicillin-binding protein 1C